MNSLLWLHCIIFIFILVTKHSKESSYSLVHAIYEWSLPGVNLIVNFHYSANVWSNVLYSANVCMETWRDTPVHLLTWWLEIGVSMWLLVWQTIYQPPSCWEGMPQASWSSWLSPTHTRSGGGDGTRSTIVSLRRCRRRRGKECKGSASFTGLYLSLAWVHDFTFNFPSWVCITFRSPSLLLSLVISSMI